MPYYLLRGVTRPGHFPRPPIYRVLCQKPSLNTKPILGGQVTDEYAIDYFSEEQTVKKWKQEHVIVLDNSKWKAELKNKQEQLARLDLGFDVDKISDNIRIRAIVPMNQTNPGFGDKNSKLTGSKVNTTGLRVVEDEDTVRYPLGGSISKTSKFGDPSSLKPGQTYSVSRETPLMPEFSPSDPMKALESVKYIQKGGQIKVTSVRQKDNQPWYQVEVIHVLLPFCQARY